MSKQKIVVSLGHDALGYTTNEQLDRVKIAAKALADLVEANYQLTITHSNGPQISMIHKAMSNLHKMYSDYTAAPMSVCNAMSQGYVGYDLQNSLRSELVSRGISKPVSTILTQVSVDPYDEAFYEPSKIIGRYMNADEAELEVNKGNYVVEDESKGFRRVIAAPTPLKIIELETIKVLVNADQAVIACGGGGIPVIEQNHQLKGASAVIEKDSIAGKLAAELQSDMLVILTNVDQVYLNFGKDTQEALSTLTTQDATRYAEAGEFGSGTMLPKIQAALTYLDAVPTGKVLITSMARIKDAIAGNAGTLITK